MTAHAIQQGHCPYCNRGIRRISELRGGSKPCAGDLSICFSCGELVAFNQDLTIRKPTGEESMAASKSPDVYRLQTTIKQMVAAAKGLIVVGGGTA